MHAICVCVYVCLCVCVGVGEGEREEYLVLDIPGENSVTDVAKVISV